MKKLIPLTIATATALALSTATTATAQSAQERLDARYDRALAAGYKAMMLCSAIANAQANGTSRTPESVHEWELSGIQAPLNDIVQELPYEIVRSDTGLVRHVRVTWSGDMPPRVARHDSGYGCVNMPIGTDPETFKPELEVPPVPDNTKPLSVGTGMRSDPSPFDERQRFRLKSGAFDGATYGEGTRTSGLVVLQSGSIALEAYAPTSFGVDTPQRTWSVAKSMAATLVGAAVHKEQATIDDPIPTRATPAAGDPRNAITIDHALRMASGRYSDTAGNRTDPLYWGGTTVDERAANWPLVHKPGTRFRYANNDTLMAIQAIEGSIQVGTVRDFLASLGMNQTVAETDWQGNHVLSSQVWSTARDLAKLGQLYLNDGVLPDGTRILPEGWVDYVSNPSGPQPEGTQWGYGAGWWTFRRPEGNAFEGIPDDAFAARGNRGQYIVVVPSRQVVIVRRGEDMVGTRFDIAAFTRDVLAALER